MTRDWLPQRHRSGSPDTRRDVRRDDVDRCSPCPSPGTTHARPRSVWGVFPQPRTPSTWFVPEVWFPYPFPPEDPCPDPLYSCLQIWIPLSLVSVSRWSQSPFRLVVTPSPCRPSVHPPLGPRPTFRCSTTTYDRNHSRRSLFVDETRRGGVGTRSYPRREPMVVPSTTSSAPSHGPHVLPLLSVRLSDLLSVPLSSHSPSPDHGTRVQAGDRSGQRTLLVSVHLKDSHRRIPTKGKTPSLRLRLLSYPLSSRFFSLRG